ncbi:uncharacterized protein LOC110006571 [Amborella trichopoda]|uniref:uncharacterized protein LOC110006571 n=1 Tax=Amborella trichopoda TaxID=13333 RepID=UPI0009BC89FA|nr:uncharacterized protein LOC110006571 [Amborella trichopoda]|eukprot:XP_020518104.1 uncharacterized protein LOC110006571 [Amborella trichopoda]
MGKKKSRCFASLPNPYDWFLKFKNAADLTSKRTNCSNNQKFTCRRKLVNDGFYNSSESAVLSEFSSSNLSPVNINSDISPEQDGSEELINNSLLPLLDENESFKANIDGSSESVNFRRSLSDGCDSPRSSVSSRTLGGGGQQILVNVAGTSLHNGWDSADESTGKSYHLARKHSNGEGNSFQAKDNEEKSAKCTDQRKSWSNSCLRSIEGRNHSRKSFKEPKASETIEVDAINKKNEILKAEDCGTLTLQFLDKERTDVYYKENRSLKSHGSGTRHRTVNDERAVKKGFYIYVTNGNSQNFSTKEACKNFSFESPGPPIKERSYLASEKGDQRLQQEDRKALRSVNENCVELEQ